MASTLSDKPNSYNALQHGKFRYLIALIRFLRTINDDIGYPSLNEASILGGDPSSGRERFIDALTTILVLNHEVIAVVPLIGHPEDAIVIEQNGSRPPECDKTNAGGETSDDGLEVVFCDETKASQTPPEGDKTNAGGAEAVSHDETKASQTSPEEDGGYDLVDASWFAAVPNPRVRDRGGPEGADSIYLLDEGEDFWPQCQTGDFTQVLRMGRSAPPLESHVKTISSYLRTRRAVIGNTEQKTCYESHFKTYIVISCYRKMRRRFATWSALGLIYNLASISEAQLASAASGITFADGEVLADRSVGKLVGILPMDDLKRLVESDEDLHVPAPDLELLKAAAQDAEYVGLYNRTTMKQFHYFFVRLLIAFARQLVKVSTRPNNIIDLITRDTVPAADALAVVAHSYSLSYHLDILAKTRETLSFPTINHRNDYSNFAVKLQMPFFSGLGKEAAIGSDVGSSDPADAIGGGIEHSAASGYSGGNLEQPGPGDEQDGDRGEEFSEMARLRSPRSSGLTFRRWIKSFISHFSAIRALESHSTKRLKDKDIHIHLLGAKRTNPVSASRSTMIDLIRELMDEMNKDGNAKYGAISKPLTFDKVMSDMRSHISAYRAAENKSLYNKVYRQFDGLLMESSEDGEAEEDDFVDLFNGGLHSEAIVGAAAPAVGNMPVLDDEQTKMNIAEVSVSKLCCPICWDLLEVLRNGNLDILQVRGRHSFLYDVELPSWLSVDALDKMVTRYSAYAKKELKKLQRVDKDGNRFHRHLSGSESDASFTSGYSVDVQKMHESMNRPVTG